MENCGWGSTPRQWLQHCYGATKWNQLHWKKRRWNDVDNSNKVGYFKLQSEHILCSISKRDSELKCPRYNSMQYLFCFVFSGIELKLKGMLGSDEKIQSLEDTKKTIPSQSTKLTGRNIHLPATMSSTIGLQLCALPRWFELLWWYCQDLLWDAEDLR